MVIQCVILLTTNNFFQILLSLKLFLLEFRMYFVVLFTQRIMGAPMNPDDKKSYSSYWNTYLSIGIYTCISEEIFSVKSTNPIIIIGELHFPYTSNNFWSSIPRGRCQKMERHFSKIRTRSSELRRNWGSAEPKKRIDLEKYILGSQRNILISDENLYLARCTTSEGGVMRRVIKWGGKIIASARDDDRRRQNNFGVPSVSFHFHGNDVGSIRRDSDGSTDGWAPYTHEFPEPQSIRSRDCSSDCFGLNGSGRKEGKKQIKNARRSWGIYADGVKEKENVLHLSSSRK